MLLCKMDWMGNRQFGLFVLLFTCVIVPKKSVVGKGESCHVMCLHPFTGTCVTKTARLVLKQKCTLKTKFNS